MKLTDLIDALAAEVELAQPHLERCLDGVATLAVDSLALGDALDAYREQADRMGEAAEMVGFLGLQRVCEHVASNAILLGATVPAERAPLLEFLRAWPGKIVMWLRHMDDPSTAAGLIDLMRGAPFPMGENDALKIMHMLGAMPALAALPGAAEQPLRPVLATPDDVALDVPADADARLLEGFFTEAPGQARQLVETARRLVRPEGPTNPRDDLALAKRLVHTLKGTGAVIGLRGLAAIGHHLEDVLEHFEHHGGQVPAGAGDAVLDAANCLEQMVGHLQGSDDFPQQALAVLQQVLDVANRIDRGDDLAVAAVRPPMPAPAPLMAQDIPVPVEPMPAPAVVAPEPVASRPATPAAPAVPASPVRAEAAGPVSTSLRVSVQHVDELFRVSGEVSSHSAAMETRLKALHDRARELVEQNLRLQRRLFELETVVNVRSMSRRHTLHTRAQPTAGRGFDSLEMDEYNELHSTTHALIEEAADARTLALRLQDDLGLLGGVQTQQQRLAKDLQHLVIGVRMTAVGVIEPRLQRNVRATCQSTGKQARLELTGGATLIDGDMLNRLPEPLLHLLRNAVDHGLESPDERVACGKPAEGLIQLDLARQGQMVVLRCRDDGRGLDLAAIRRRAVERGLVGAGTVLADDDAARLILQPGFSTRDAVTDVSGRGVGLDVVNDWVRAMNGSIRIESAPGAGCLFEIRFAATLSTSHSLVVEASGQRFALPSVQVEQAVARGLGTFERVGGQLTYRLGARLMPARALAEAAGLPAGTLAPAEHDAVLVRVDGRVQALAVERLIDSRELLVKHPGRFARHLRGVAGLSILGDGGVAVQADLTQLLAARGATDSAAAAVPAAARPRDTRPAVLVVDDALSVRNALLQLVQDAGYRAEAARDGVEAIDALRRFRPDVVLTDLEMPNMNGIELTQHLRGRDDLGQVPIIMITSRSQDKHRRLADEVGVSTYLTKPYHEGELLRLLREALAGRLARRQPQEAAA